MKISHVLMGLLLAPAAFAETLVIEASGPNVPGEKVFKCSRIESTALVPSTKIPGGWVTVPKSMKVEGCSAEIFPGRNYQVFIVMEVWNTGQLTKTYILPPYFVWIPPNSVPSTTPKPPTNLHMI